MGEGKKGTGDTGIILDGHDNVIQNSEIAYSAGNGVSLIGDNNTVDNCEIHDVNYVVTEAACISSGHENTKNNRITNNKLYNAGRSIINIQEAWNLKILNNEMHHSRYGGEVWDLGVIYSIATDGHGTEIAYNYMYDYRSMGLYFDANSDNYYVHHNVVEKCGNFNALWGSIAYNMRIYNNTILGPAVMNSQDTEFIIKNNIFGTIARTPAGYVTSENIALNAVDPYTVFAGYDAGNYRLKSGSPAIDTGVDLGFSEDFDGTAIPQGAAPDIGAFEHVPGSLIVTALALEGGVIDPSGSIIVTENGNQPFTITPNQCHSIKELMFDDGQAQLSVSVLNEVGISKDTGIGTYTLNNIDGYYSITVSFAINYGDVDDSRGATPVTLEDAQLVENYLAGINTLTHDQKKAADVSGDGEVTAQDAQLIANYANGVIAEFPIEGSLVAWWRFEDEGDIVDQSTYGNNGTNYGSTFTPEGKIGGARIFDGVDDYITIDNSPSVDFSTDLTVAAWVKTNNAEKLQGIVAKLTDDYFKQYVLSIVGNRLRFDYEEGGGNYALSGGVILNDTWHHVGFTIDNLLNVKLYIDGVEVASDVAPEATISKQESIVIGKWPNYYNRNYFNGSIDEVMIYKRALAQEEVQELYDTGISPPVLLYGDIDNNGQISAQDASLAARFSIGLVSLTPEQQIAADVDGIPGISANDAAFIARKSVGLIDRFPVEE